MDIINTGLLLLYIILVYGNNNGIAGIGLYIFGVICILIIKNFYDVVTYIHTVKKKTFRLVMSWRMISFILVGPLSHRIVINLDSINIMIFILILTILLISLFSDIYLLKQERYGLMESLALAKAKLSPEKNKEIVFNNAVAWEAIALTQLPLPWNIGIAIAILCYNNKKQGIKFELYTVLYTVILVIIGMISYIFIYNSGVEIFCSILFFGILRVIKNKLLNKTSIH